MKRSKKYDEAYIKSLRELYKRNRASLKDASQNFWVGYFLGRHRSGIDRAELWEILVALSGNEISLAEAHDRIVKLAGGGSSEKPNNSGCEIHFGS